MAVHIVWSEERKMSLACRAGNLSPSRHYPAELIELRLQQWGRCSIHNSTRTWWRWHRRLHQLILLFAPEKNVTRRREKKKIIGARRGENRRETKLYSAPGRCFMYLCVYKLEVDLMGLPEIRRSSWGGAETKPLFSLSLSAFYRFSGGAPLAFLAMMDLQSCSHAISVGAHVQHTK